MRKTIFILLIFSISLADSAMGQSTFEKIFRINNQSTEVYSTFPVSDGYVLLSQHGKGIINLTKLDSNGEFITGKDVFDTNSGFVMSSSVTSSGNFLVTGVVNVEQDSENTSQTGFLLKVSPDLNLVSAYNFMPFAGNGDTWASGARETSDGNVIVLAKSTVTSIGGFDNYFEVIKLDKALNNIIWQKAILAGSDNTVFDIAETTAGYEIYGALKHNDSNWNLYLGTISKDGTRMKRQLIMGGEDWDGAYDFMDDDGKQKVRNNASSIVNIDGNNLAIAAYSRSYGSNPSASDDKVGKSILMISVPTSGDSYNWAAKIDGGKNDQVFGPFGGGNFISLTNSDLLLTGYTNSTGTSAPYPGAFVYRFAAKSNGTITPRWQHVFTPPNNMSPLGLSETSNGNILISGRSGASTEEGIIIETTADGVNPVGCISANYGNLGLTSFTPSVISTTNAALFDGTLLTQLAPYSQWLGNETSITIVCSAQSTDEAESPAISMQPAGQSIASGQTASVSVMSTGTPPMHYQWFEGESGNESNQVGTDSSAFVTPELTETTDYWVKISNGAGELNSATATISIENLKWFQDNWPDPKQAPFNLTLGANNTVLVTTRDVVTQFGPNDWPCGSPPGNLVAIDPNDGSIKWSLDVGHSAPPAVASYGSIYTNIENRLYAINPSNGSKTLVYTAEHNFTSSPAISATGRIFIGAMQNVLAIDVASGTLIWEAPTDKVVINQPCIRSNDNEVYVIPGFISSRMYSFWANKAMFNETQTAWVRDINGFFSTGPVIGENGTIYAGVGSNLVAFSRAGGVEQWSFTTPIAPAGYPTIQSITSEPVISNNGTIYFSASCAGDSKGALFAVHPDGYPKWFFPTEFTLYTSPLLAKNETIFFPGIDLHVLDLFGNELSKKEGAGRITPILDTNGKLYGGSYLNAGIFALTTNSGGLMQAHWPSIGQNPQRTGRHDDSFVGIPPTITQQPENQIIKSGESATFKVSASGDPTITYQWYEGVLGDKSNPVGSSDSSYTTPPLNKQTNYWVEAENEFGRDASTTVMASTGNEAEAKWFFNTNTDYNRDEDGEIDGGVALAQDGTIYFVVSDGRLFAMNPDGTLKWKTPLPNIFHEYYDADYFGRGAPTIGTDGTIYYGILGWHHGPGGYRNFGFLQAINPDGSEKWLYKTGEEPAGEGSTMPWIQGTAATGHDGTIYVSSEDGVLHALNSNGALKWKFNPFPEFGNSGVSPAVGQDGTIYYVAGWWQYNADMSINVREIYLFAIKSDGSLQWKFKFEGKVYYSHIPPSIGPDGKIYVGCTIYINDGNDNLANLYAINPDGTEAWQFSTGEYISTPATIDADGTVYVGGWIYENSTHKNTLYALNPDGTEKWQIPSPDGPYGNSAPTIGADGILYYVSYNGKLQAYNRDGTPYWTNPPYVGAGESPLIAPDGTIYIPQANSGQETRIYGYLWAINSSTFGVANTPWPMTGYNPQRTQRVPGFPPCEEPEITTQPKDTTIYAGDAVKLTVNAKGNDLIYQWYKGTDRSTLVGNDECLITSSMPETSTFWVRVSNTCGFADSRLVTVTVTNEGANIQETALSQILVNNIPLEGFLPSILEYNYSLIAGSEIPEVSAIAATLGAKVEVIQSTSFNEPATIIVYSSDEATARTYTINYIIGTGTENMRETGGVEIFLYPNPATDRLNIQSLSFIEEDIGLEIMDVQGKKWIKKQFVPGKETIDIDVSKLKGGVYFSKIQFGDKCVTKKLIIQKH